MVETDPLKNPGRLSEEIKALIRGANFAHLATLMRDGTPQVDPVWVDLEGDAMKATQFWSPRARATLRPRTRIAIRGWGYPSLPWITPTRKPRYAVGSSSGARIGT